MRQIVQIHRPIVQTSALGVAGHANATPWYGEEAEVAWPQEIGYLLVTGSGLETQCAAGYKTQLTRGDLLVVNESAAPTFTTLLATQSASTPRAFYGALRRAAARCELSASSSVFAPLPTWSMALIKLPEREFTRAVALAQLIANESQVGEHQQEIVKTIEASLFQALASELWVRDPMSLPQLLPLDEPRLARAVAAINADPARAWRIETMAHEAAMSRTAFALRFKKITGQTPLGYLTALRVQAAVTLMSTQRTQSVESIARDVGYADESALRRAHLRAVGVPLQRRA